MTAKIILIAATLLAGMAQPGNWKTDPGTAKISFTVKGPFGTVNGDFSGLKSDLRLDEKNMAASSMSASVQASTVSTGIGLRNRDLRKKSEWLDTDKYPLISFRSTKIEKTGAAYKASGELTLKGVTKPLSIPFTFSTQGNTGLLKGQFSINRTDFNIGKSGGSVGETVTILLEIPIKK